MPISFYSFFFSLRRLTASLLHGRLSLLFSSVRMVISVPLTHVKRSFNSPQSACKKGCEKIGPAVHPWIPSRADFNTANSELESGPSQLMSSGPIHCCGQAFLESLWADLHYHGPGPAWKGKGPGGYQYIYIYIKFLIKIKKIKILN